MRSLNEVLNEAFNDYKLGTSLGSGCAGEVFDIGSGKVLKRIDDPSEQLSEINKFYEYCSKHNTVVFPKVYEYDENYVVTEKLSPVTDKCILYADLVCNYNGKEWLELDIPDSWVKKKSSFFIIDVIKKLSGDKLSKTEDAIKKLSSSHWEVYLWIKEVYNILKKIGIDWYQTDFKHENLGERKNGEVVWFDI